MSESDEQYILIGSDGESLLPHLGELLQNAGEKDYKPIPSDDDLLLLASGLADYAPGCSLRWEKNARIDRHEPFGMYEILDPGGKVYCRRETAEGMRAVISRLFICDGELREDMSNFT